ncbi:hypothetical protein KBW71_03270 [Hydrogenophaga aromaticivorans]|uniref:hypothetical protein n=1 Tax=Hydrogenophaga aromaticivorans TaxID=2610898 RepID=UPI001B37AB35|nr:hypothetical protein [Hydrogenophaga aromaticivorans]MBQ0917449.1 hypothetical protein [Hydrogenophaga aromaticivorans]
MKIKYVGLKGFEDAFKGESGKTWGPGVEHDIEDAGLCARMLKHPDVFALVDGVPVKEPESLTLTDVVVVDTDVGTVGEQIPDEPGNEQVSTQEPVSVEPAGKHVMQTSSGPLALDGLDKDTLKALAKELDIAVGNSGEEKIRQKLAEAFPVKV